MDDIEKLLAEVSPGEPGREPSPARQSASSRSGRLAFAAIAGVTVGAAGWIGGLLLPFLGSVSMGLGAALGAFVTALVGGPPRWFSS